MKHEVAELEGVLLDAAVAQAEGITLIRRHTVGGMRQVFSSEGTFADEYTPSTSWGQGGPIIERELISITAESRGWWADVRYCSRPQPHEEGPMCTQGRGPTPLIAAMRAVVASKFGDEVELP